MFAEFESGGTVRSYEVRSQATPRPAWRCPRATPPPGGIGAEIGFISTREGGGRRRGGGAGVGEEDEGAVGGGGKGLGGRWKIVGVGRHGIRVDAEAAGGAVGGAGDGNWKEEDGAMAEEARE